MSEFARYVAAMAMVAAAVLVAFICKYAVEQPSLALVFVLPVAVAAAQFGWRPALAAAIAGTLAFDFFFVPPVFSLSVASPAGVWTMLLLLIVAAVVSSVAARSRKSALDAREAAAHADALQGLAHVVILAQGEAEVTHTAADALGRLFDAPAAVLVEKDQVLAPAALTDGAALTSADTEAARASLSTNIAIQAGSYPYDGAAFDFWPVASPGHARFVLGVDFSGHEEGRPADSARLVELVAGYLAVAFAFPRPANRLARPAR
jgi:two-component system sensor histidine kinase KdpD